MTISWLGFNYFKLQNSQRSLIFNPYALDKGTKFGKAKADVILFSDPAKIATTKVDKESFIIDSAGEYEVNEIFIYGRRVGKNIIYMAVMEDIKVVCLGDFVVQDLSNGDLELIEGADILILPVGGGGLLDAKAAVKLISKIEPRVVIPSCYAGGAGKLKVDKLTSFIKEFGVKAEEHDKYKVKKSDLPQEDVKLVVLKTQ